MKNKKLVFGFCVVFLQSLFSVQGLNSKPIVSPRIKKAGPVEIKQPTTVKPKRELDNPFLNTKIDIMVKNAPLNSFLSSISAQADINFIWQKGVEKEKITAFMRGVTVRTALDSLLSSRGLAYEQILDSKVFVISKTEQEGPRLITKIFTLKFISLLPVMSVNQAMSAITAQDSGSSVTSAGTSTGLESSGSASTIKGVEGVGQKGYESGVAILNVIRSVLSRNGKIAVEPRTNSVIITDVAQKFSQIEQIIAELDVKSPQVLIEAQIVEISTDKAKNLGIDWGTASDGTIASYQGPVRESSYFVRQGFFNEKGWKNFFTAGDAITAGKLDLSSLQVFLRALVTRTEARYLGRPKVVTLNNKTAIITTSRDAALSVTQSTADVGGGTLTETVERSRIGLTLRVTPQINVDEYITLLVQPSYSNLVTSTVVSGSGNILDPVSRGVSTQVRVKNGETIVIGGLISSDEETTVRKVPLLGSIPILGWLFSSKSTTKVNTDLVIFITPTILKD